MRNATTTDQNLQAPSATATLDEIVREGARRLLKQAIEEEVAAYVAAHAELRDADGRRLVVRNGHAPLRSIQSNRPATPPITPLESALGGR